MSSPPLKTLFLTRHSLDPAHRLLRNIRYMLMGWCRHRGVSLKDLLEWVWQGKEDTTKRRARYSQDRRAWGEKRPPNNKHVERVLMTLYPSVCFTYKDARIYRQTHSLKTIRIGTCLFKPRGKMALIKNFKR